MRAAQLKGGRRPGSVQSSVHNLLTKQTDQQIIDETRLCHYCICSQGLFTFDCRDPIRRTANPPRNNAADAGSGVIAGALIMPLPEIVNPFPTRPDPSKNPRRQGGILLRRPYPRLIFTLNQQIVKCLRLSDCYGDHDGTEQRFNPDIEN